MTPPRSEQNFTATLGTRERLITYAVGLGVGLGVPLFLGLLFFFLFSDPWTLLLPLPFALALGTAYLFAPRGYALHRNAILIHRKAGSWC